ncbi:Insulin-degrading enzyme [Papilio xuthus]|uniref:Insulin-degrading enzyme n=1 Tax=Papilio xuthus TaxID=66420 RepID=A0A194Q9X8_PAPXU|nr:Insulin-degrading enzyme [Papilio xuthus]
MSNYAAEAPAGPGPGARGSPVTIENASYSVLKRYDNIVKSKEDKREYRGLELTNRLKVLLVSDETTDKSAAALCVNVGYLSDPDELPGLAHFCEHMLFLGTKKYPQENEYNKFLSEHGGSSNAYTTPDHTLFYFDVLPQHLPQVLDIFSQFFICPLFTESATGRELNAVDFEHENNVYNDTWRLTQFNKSTSTPGHPYTKFGTGNKQTLEVIPKQKGIDVRKELLKFHHTWYSANIMALVVVGKESLDELEEMVAPLFTAIEDRNVTAPSWPQHPYPPELCRRRAYVLPIKDLRTLSIEFPIPDYLKYYKNGPLYYLTSLVGHEGPGSLLAALKDKGWVDSLVGDARTGARGFGFFAVHVDLTEDGLDHIDDIVNMLFQYISMLREEGPQRWLWDEQKDILWMDFTYRDMIEPKSCAIKHARMLQEFPMEDILRAYYYLSDWKPELIEEVLTRLVPNNVRIGVVAKHFAEKCTQIEPWYGTKYYEEEIEESKIKEWEKARAGGELHLPPPNEFLPDRLELETSHDSTTDSIAPIILKDTPLMRLWFKRDNEFKLPKAYLTVDFFSPVSYADPESSALMSMWMLLVRDGLQEYAYAADLAGLRWHVTVAKQALNDTPLMRLWFKRDNEFKLPKAYLTVDFFSPVSYADPESSALMSMWMLLVRDGLQEYAYAADLAGLRWHVTVAKQALNIFIEGYDDKQHVLLDKIVEHVVHFKADPKRFKIMKENHIRALKNFDAEQPYQHAFYQQTLCLVDVAWTRCELLAAAKDISVEKLEVFVSRLLRKVHVEAFMMGNITREKALNMADNIENKLPKEATPLLAQELISYREVELGKGCWFLRRTENSVHKSSCALVHYACGARTSRANVTLELVAHVLSEPTFNVLRTKEQLGYLVFSGVRQGNSCQGLRLVVQSDRHPDYLEQRIEAFLKTSQEDLEKMSEEQFLKHRSTLAAQRLERPKRMYSKASRIWSEIVRQVYNFDRARVEVEQLNTITKDELLQFYKKHISPESEERQKLSVHVVSTAAGGAGTSTQTHTEHDAEDNDQQVYNFDRARVEVEQLNTITKDELLQFYKKHISPESEERQKLSVHVVSTAAGGAGTSTQTHTEHDTEDNDQQSQVKAVRIEDLVDFKCRRRLYPLPAPHTNIPRKGTHCKL